MEFVLLLIFAGLIGFAFFVKKVIISSETPTHHSANDRKSNVSNPPKKQLSQKKREDLISMFSGYLDMFVYSPQISDNPLKKPITAAYLFAILDFLAVTSDQSEKSRELLPIIENKILKKSDVSSFTASFHIFSELLCRNIKPRGDWMFYDGEKESNILYELFICYGDLIRYPDYVFGYETAPLKIEDIFELTSFANKFSTTILRFTDEYVHECVNKLNIKI